MNKRRAFLTSSWALVLSVPCMALASRSGFGISLSRDSWWLVALALFMSAAFVSLMVRGQFSLPERHVLSLVFLFGAWWELTAVLLAVSHSKATNLAFVVGLLIAGLAVRYAWKTEHPPRP